MASTLSGLVLCLLVATAVATEYKYEFGEKYGGKPIAEKSGVIPPFQYSTDVTVSVPPLGGMQLSYVKVVVNAINPPKVDFDWDTNTVSITYSYLEVTASKYKITAKAQRIYEPYRG